MFLLFIQAIELRQIKKLKQRYLGHTSDFMVKMKTKRYTSLVTESSLDAEPRLPEDFAEVIVLTGFVVRSRWIYYVYICSYPLAYLN